MEKIHDANKLETKKRVIIVTDGDKVARKAVETAAENVGGRCISASSGNPTTLSAKEIVDLINQTPHDPVLVMVDDEGNQNQGQGESALQGLLANSDIQVMGVVAVASQTVGVEGVPIDYSVTRDGEITKVAVNKIGQVATPETGLLKGDTVDVLNHANVPIIVGIGDPGKMEHHDDYFRGAPITTKAVQFILDHSDN